MDGNPNVIISNDADIHIQEANRIDRIHISTLSSVGSDPGDRIGHRIIYRGIRRCLGGAQSKVIVHRVHPSIQSIGFCNDRHRWLQYLRMPSKAQEES